MGLFRWLKSRWETAPTNRVRAVTCKDEGLECRWCCSAASVKWDDIQRIVIRTTDLGPFDADVFFVIEAAGLRFVIPQDAAGTDELLERLQRLPGFDNQAVIDSMVSTGNKDFLCWQRESGETQ